METTWYWCLKHERVERDDERDAPEFTLGPYPSEDAARNWKALNEARNEAWVADDEEWSGEAPAED